MAAKTDLIYVPIWQNKVVKSEKTISDGRNKNILIHVDTVMKRFETLVRDVSEQKYFVVS